ncbi:SET domain-containing protein [Sistotremastrum niveocremeum HHB9708]|uniref:SET domain-containing protein n=1 Tax=Sistotremastrum niveocremeum HHB9708 TaxID=1314777 RepID=A0A164WWD3_9AGAM|nr:SET domain-containing protein [Sistotremastrum niveocremeum HHB9708]
MFPYTLLVVILFAAQVYANYTVSFQSLSPGSPITSVVSGLTTHKLSKGLCKEGFSGARYCILYSYTFDARGISILALEEKHEYLWQRLALWASNPYLAHMPSSAMSRPSFAEVDVLGKGKGLAALRVIFPGEIVLAERPLILIDAQLKSEYSPQDIISLRRELSASLPQESHEYFMQLSGWHEHADPVDSRFDSNSFNINLGGEDTFHGLFPAVARLNHDCRPNLEYNWSEDTATMTLHAARRIEKDEELTISYVRGDFSSHQRQSRLKSTWGFDCACSLCSLPSYLQEESDNRLVILNDSLRMLDSNRLLPADKPAIAERLVHLVEMERLYTLLPESYAYAARAYAEIEDKHTALKYTTLAIEHGLRILGAEWKSWRELVELEEKLLKPNGRT